MYDCKLHGVGCGGDDESSILVWLSWPFQPLHRWLAGAQLVDASTLPIRKRGD